MQTGRESGRMQATGQALEDLRFIDPVSVGNSIEGPLEYEEIMRNSNASN